MRLKVNRSFRSFLKRGGIVAYATESCFGLGCDPHHAVALSKLLHLKRRDQSKGMIVIGANRRQVMSLCQPFSHAQSALLRKTWPAAHTFVVPAHTHCHPLLTGGRAKIAVRVPDHQGARRLCEMAGMPLVSTSANISGRKSIKTYHAALRKFAGRVMVFPGLVGHYRKPSTVQDIETGQFLRK